MWERVNAVRRTHNFCRSGNVSYILVALGLVNIAVLSIHALGYPKWFLAQDVVARSKETSGETAYLVLPSRIVTKLT